MAGRGKYGWRQGQALTLAIPRARGPGPGEMSSVNYQMSSVKCQVSSIKCQIYVKCQMSNAYVDPWDVLNNVSFVNVNAQMSLFMDENNTPSTVSGPIIVPHFL